MTPLNIWIPCYDDLDQLTKALSSLKDVGDRVDVYVVDGRYATFPGEGNTTDGAEGVCDQLDFVECVTPPRLPIQVPRHVRYRVANVTGIDPGLFRLPQHAQAKWVNYELLPQDQWALEMDTDERLDRIDWEVLADLDPQRKYSPEVITPDGEDVGTPVRLYQPRYWTFWIDDVLFWREWYPRDTPVEEIFEAHTNTSHRATNYGGSTSAVRLWNHGRSRPDDYRDRRADQLETMGAAAAAEAVRDGKQPAMTDLKQYLADIEMDT